MMPGITRRPSRRLGRALGTSWLLAGIVLVPAAAAEDVTCSLSGASPGTGIPASFAREGFQPGTSGALFAELRSDHDVVARDDEAAVSDKVSALRPLAFAPRDSRTLGDDTHARRAVSLQVASSVGARPSAGEAGDRTWLEQLSGAHMETSTAQSYDRSAIVMSLVLPGLAQYRMGEKERGLAFMALEATFWASFAAFRIQGANREDSYAEMAELFAGISPDAPRDEDFYKAISNWPSSDLYNEIVVRRLARAAGGDDLDAREAYYEANKVQGNETWAWSSELARDDFGAKRTDAQQSFKRSRNMVGLAVANRAVAMIDAVLLSNRLRGTGYGLEVTQYRDGPDFISRVGLRRRFP